VEGGSPIKRGPRQERGISSRQWRGGGKGQPLKFQIWVGKKLQEICWTGTDFGRKKESLSRGTEILSIKFLRNLGLKKDKEEVCRGGGGSNKRKHEGTGEQEFCMVGIGKKGIFPLRKG